jgi:hypothetical protein
MDWINKTEEYAGTNGWGARSKFIGISRMLNDSDLTHIQNNKMVSSVRPRGIISGFLAIVPTLGYAVFLPPVAAKMGPQRIRMRISDELKQHGAIFSAYMTKSENSKTLVIEDILLWNTQPMWFTKRFEERISTMKIFTQHFKQDTLLQGCKIVFAKYNSWSETVEPDAKHVLEFVPNQASQKRLIWMKPKEEALQSVLTARKEVGAGPDVFMIYKDGQKLGQALVRTLVVSRLLRAALTEHKTETPVTAEFNKQFDKWEITDIPKIA